MRIDLNTDAGESFGAWSMGNDAALFPHVTSVNIACGFHAGDPSVLRRTIRMAAAAGLRVGAHPGLPDLQGFGRRSMGLTPSEVEDVVLYQVAAVAGIARAEGVRIAHVKPHGALYNQAVGDPSMVPFGAACASPELYPNRRLNKIIQKIIRHEPAHSAPGRHGPGHAHHPMVL